jgi:hypothetical protein
MEWDSLILAVTEEDGLLLAEDVTEGDGDVELEVE